MDPYTGEILAEATYPSYDANDYRSIAAIDPTRFIDPIVSSVYEPGSVFKMLTAIAGLETETVTTKTKIKDVGTLKLDGGRTHVDDADHRGMGWMTFEDAIAYSRNVVAAKVALGLGETTARVVGDPPRGVVAARVRPADRRSTSRARSAASSTTRRSARGARSTSPTGRSGRAIAVTPIQLATAFAAMVNGGTLVQPHVVKAIGTREIDPAPRGQVIDPALSTTLIGMMNHVVTEVPFYRDRTLVKGYDVGGKTGTAQIWDPTAREGRGDWKHNLFNYSFVGYIGRDAGVPDLVVSVKINEGTPTIARIGQLEMPVMSFELFRRIATDAITRPGLLPERRTPAAPLTADR